MDLASLCWVAKFPNNNSLATCKHCSCKEVWLAANKLCIYRERAEGLPELVLHGVRKQNIHRFLVICTITITTIEMAASTSYRSLPEGSVADLPRWRALLIFCTKSIAARWLEALPTTGSASTYNGEVIHSKFSNKLAASAVA